MVYPKEYLPLLSMTQISRYIHSWNMHCKVSKVTLHQIIATASTIWSSVANGMPFIDFFRDPNSQKSQALRSGE
jgi:hypothetical protein